MPNVKSTIVFFSLYYSSNMFVCGWIQCTDGVLSKKRLQNLLLKHKLPNLHQILMHETPDWYTARMIDQGVLTCTWSCCCTYCGKLAMFGRDSHQALACLNSDWHQLNVPTFHTDGKPLAETWEGEEGHHIISEQLPRPSHYLKSNLSLNSETQAKLSPPSEQRTTTLDTNPKLIIL